MLGKQISYEVSKGQVELAFEHGRARIEIWTDNIIRVFCPVQDEGYHSKAVSCEGPDGTVPEVSKEQDALVIRTAALTAKVYDDFYVDFYRADGTLLCADYRGARRLRRTVNTKLLALMQSEGHDVSRFLGHDYPVQTVKALAGDEKFYGLGDKTGFLNKRNYEYENWNTDDPHPHTDAHKMLYKTVPFLITIKDAGVFGLFFDNTFRSYINLGREQESRLTTLGTDIYTYVESMYAHWVVDGGIEDEWDDYLAQLDQMGLQELLEIQKNAYAAYQESMSK